MSTDSEEVDWDYVYERNRRIWLGLDAPQESKSSDHNHDHDHDGTAMEEENNNYAMRTNNNYIENDRRRGEKPEGEGGITLKGMPFLPKNLGTPKNVIPQWYERHHKGFSFRSNDCFFSWNDNGKAHEMYWTSIFKCPVTGELFGSGQFGDDRSSYQVRRERINGATNDGDIVEEVVEEQEGEQKIDEFVSAADKKVDIVWHRKKKDAEHAAAARALDCLSFRDGGGVSSMCYGLCREEPYLEGQEEMNDGDDDNHTKATEKFAIPSSVPPHVFDWLLNECVGLPMQIEKD